MFTAPAPSAPTISTSTSQASPSSPTRPSRLRGLSYLRNYTRDHIHSHPGHSSRPHLGARARSHPPPRDDSTGDSQEDSATTRASRPQMNGGDNMTTGRRSRQQEGSTPTGNSAPRLSTRSRAESATASVSLRNATASMSNNSGKSANKPTDKNNQPSIRFIPHIDPRAPRPSLTFSPISRTLPDESAIIRVGRYSERDSQPEIPQNVASSAPVGFKSKVVSRRHCEFWWENNQWWIKDVKSSSGTFLNHIRLSSPGDQSTPYAVKDGDVVQLGIDFRGGEEMIFRCVKIRIECNRGWQQGLNSFNKSTYKKLKNLAKTNAVKKDSDAASSHSSECSICLMSIAPCQSLFVAPCSHVWHYKCIRPILQGPTAPTFLCPNCRAVTDLEEDVDEPNGFTESDDSEVEAAMQESNGAVVTPPDSDAAEPTPRAITPLVSNGPSGPNGTSNTNAAEGTQTLIGIPTSNPTQGSGAAQTDEPDVLDGVGLEDAIASMAISEGQLQSSDSDSHFDSNQVTDATNSTSAPVSISTVAANTRARTLSPGFNDTDFPMTPRNDAGPFVLDGSAGRSTSPRRGTESESHDIADIVMR